MRIVREELKNELLKLNMTLDELLSKVSEEIRPPLSRDQEWYTIRDEFKTVCNDTCTNVPADAHRKCIETYMLVLQHDVMEEFMERLLQHFV